MKEKNEFEKHQAAKKYHEGQDLALRGRYEEAIESYDNAINLRPKDAKAYNNKGKCLYELGRLEESRIALEKAVKLRPYYGIAKHNRNILICKFGKNFIDQKRFQVFFLYRYSGGV